jgi:hypothetical protein
MHTYLDKRSLLDVAARAMGIWQLCLGWDDLGSYVDVLQRWYRNSYYSPQAFVFYALVHAIAGLFLVFGGTVIVKMVYGEATEITGGFQPGTEPQEANKP